MSTKIFYIRWNVIESDGSVPYLIKRSFKGLSGKSTKPVYSKKNVTIYESNKFQYKCKANRETANDIRAKEI